MIAVPQDPFTPSCGVTNSAYLQAAQVYLEQRLASGQELPADGWQRFYAIYEPLIRRFAGRCHVSADELDDCVQEVLQTIVVTLRDFKYDRRRGSFRGWLYRVVRSRATDLLRRRLRRAPRAAATSRVVERVDPTADPAVEVDRRWRAAVLQTALDQLRQEVTPRNFEVFYLRSAKELSVSEVAVRTGSTPDKVRYRHYRTIRKFRELYLLFTGEDYRPS